ncbi:MAG TPA: hypothetical protein PLB89_05115 [Flavobacteriales bacterium]|nr:hypothetical protein [Flavobacteriales bacterium]
MCRIIVSSTNLAFALGRAGCTGGYRFRRTAGELGFAVSEKPCGGLVRDFEDFDLPQPKAVALRKLMLLIAEQPVTLSWDGQQITIEEIII